jgi:hypothetical protein
VPDVVFTAVAPHDHLSATQVGTRHSREQVVLHLGVQAAH